MATDVSGTIHIIAEVMGEANSPVTGTGSRISAKEKRDRKATTISVLGFDVELKQIVKYLAIGGIIANSKIVNTSLSFVFYMLGVITDHLFIPLVGIMLPALDNLSKIFSVMAQLIHGELSWAAVWSDVKAYWQKQWTDVGFTGIVKEVFTDLTQMAVLATFFASWVLGPAAGLWILSNIFALTGAQFAVDTLGYALGLKKVKLSSVRKGTKAARLGRKIKQGTLAVGNMITNFFPKSAIIKKAALLAAVLFTAALGIWQNSSELEDGGWKEVAYGGINAASFGTWQKLADVLGFDSKSGGSILLLLSFITVLAPISVLVVADMIIGQLLGERPSTIFNKLVNVVKESIQKGWTAVVDAYNSIPDVTIINSGTNITNPVSEYLNWFLRVYNTKNR